MDYLMVFLLGVFVGGPLLDGMAYLLAKLYVRWRP